MFAKITCHVLAHTAAIARDDLAKCRVGCPRRATHTLSDIQGMRIFVMKGYCSAQSSARERIAAQRSGGVGGSSIVPGTPSRLITRRRAIMAPGVEARRGGGGRVVDGSANGAANGGAGAGGWIFGDFGLDVRLDRCPIQTVEEEQAVSMECAGCICIIERDCEC